ncbi:hypothetical protein GTW25_05735 [Aliihoeflea aestuarii]|jgi:hypothetical protein|uniref:hypothetical protein n=1 Tax=Aliihoeflea aestuarii TaxID=453840 RepID=UPI0020935E5D|nr:hypothetical protein [Aliihoeflea aestuarii]MCO6390529.1 hypothetical protein [Aliihoeflea aestuarii]
MTDIHPFIAELASQAGAREHEESEFRRTMATRVAALAEARAFANRRMNLMKSLFATVAQAQTEEIAVAGAIAALSNRLGWRENSDARDEVLVQYAKVAAAAFAATREIDDDEIVTASIGDEPVADIKTELEAFEDWYVEARGKPFWVLFEHYMPETQLVDF